MEVKLFLVLLLYILAYLKPSFGLYEDQIGKFDWTRRYVGVVEHAAFDEFNTPARWIVVATAQNVVAALSTKTGEIVWRHVMEEPNGTGGVDFMLCQGSQVTIVTGNLLRTWDTVTAALVEEIPLDHVATAGVMMRAIGVTENEVVIVELITGSVLVTTFDRSTGASLDHATIAAPWLHDQTKCQSVDKTLICVELSLGLVFTLPITAASPEFSSMPLTSLGMDDPTINPQVSLEKVAGSPDHVIIQVGSSRKLVHLHSDGLHLARDLGGSKASAILDGTLYSITQSGRVATIEAVNLESGAEIGEQGVVVELPFQSGSVLSLNIYRFERRDGGMALRAFVTCSDHSLHLLSSGGVVWSREEALSWVLSAESVDLPVEGDNINYQEQLMPSTGWIGSFIHRVKTQSSHIFHWFSSLIGSKDALQVAFGTLTRDELNLRKLLVLATRSGKILGVDNWNGDIVWSIYVPHLVPLHGNKLFLYTQRTSAHFPHQPQCVVIGKHKVTGEGLLVAFNPISGLGIGERGGIFSLGYHLTQAFLLNYADEQYLKPLLLVDSNTVPHIFPSSSESVLLKHKDATYLHLAQPGTNVLAGYSLRFSQPGELTLTEVWKVSLSGGPITGIYGKLPAEKVHSPGRVLADRSVLYKYVNPNLAVVVTQGYDHITKNTMTIYLVDTVTGAVIESVSHKKVSGPVHVIHSENWVVYSLFNDKYRCFEVTSLELYEGLSQANSSAFSSFNGYSTPLLERQAYILPIGVQAAAHTTTEKGITTKFILFALQSGGVVQMSKWLLDPRRPVTGGPREEGLIPYIPELKLMPQETITYNNTLPRITGIYTAPTGLESACVVLVHGLDLFFTRVFPSKMFDVLKDDFDHYLILGALLALTSAAIITRKLAQKKALKQAWK